MLPDSRQSEAVSYGGHCFCCPDSQDEGMARQLSHEKSNPSQTRKDLNQISEEQLVRLRESLIRFLGAHTSGRAVVSQLSLSLTNIAVVMNTWENPIKQILSIYGAQQQMTPTLLEFLSVICEELTYGNRSDLDYDELDRRSDEILKGASQIVYDLFCRTINSGDTRF